jgi:aryl-phospho-beta-D-glucosidase BglC (GH1 family)
MWNGLLSYSSDHPKGDLEPMAKNQFITVNDHDFLAGGSKITFRGFGLGNWLNLEHFMIGLPGTESQLRQAIKEAYGPENAARFWEVFWDQYITEADFQFLKSLGVNAVRISFNYHRFEDDNTPCQFADTGFAPIDRVLKLCEKYQIYAILDLHAAPGGQNPDWHSDNSFGENLFWAFPDLWKRVIALWQYIARRYRDNPWVAAYDLINEPVLNGYPVERLNQFYAKLIPTIREVDPNHLLFVEGDTYSRDFTMLPPPTDPNLAYTFHYYAFFTADEFPDKHRADAVESSLRKTITLEDIRQRLKRPIWCGETGIPVDQGNLPDLEDLLQNTLAVLEKNNISWSLWSYKDARSMGMVVPHKHSLWMDFSRKACHHWDFWGEYDQARKKAQEFITGFHVPTHERLIQKLLFRFLADNMLVNTQVYHELFSQIPFAELLTYPSSFRFENCEIHQGIADIVKKFTRV